MTDKSIEERAAEWAAQIPAEWTANVEKRVAEEMAEWEAELRANPNGNSGEQLEEIIQLLHHVFDTVAAEQQRGNE